MKVLLLGATGRTGAHILEQLLNREHTVVALVRNAAKVKSISDRLQMREGNTTDVETLRSAMQGCEAIISALNISRNSDFPWSRLRTPPDFLSSTMDAILQAAPAFPIQKIVICSAWGVHETRKDIPGWFRWFIDKSNIRVAYRDHEKQEDLLRASPFDYTIVRPVGLVNGRKVKPVQVSENNIPRPGLLIGRRSVADFMVSQLDSDQYSRKAITISKK